MIFRISSTLLIAIAVIMMGCSENLNMVGSYSEKTGIKYGMPISDTDQGYMPVKYPQQPTAPGMVFIEGGTFHMGGSEKDIGYMNDNRERQITVHSFYIDETETQNVDWKEFMYYICGFGTQNVDSEKLKDFHPDTMVWFRDLAYNEPFVELYFQNPAFNTYPVVGVDWYQANEYCKWRTLIVNSQAKKGLKDTTQYVAYPKYRLPTEAEWEYAARGLLEQELYPWEGKPMRTASGRFFANFKRGRGDYAGRSDKGASTLVEGLNDGYMIPSPVRAFFTNDFNLYNMSGNVAEWTMDTYRALAYEDVDDFNPYRRRGDVEDQLARDVQYAKPSEPYRQSLIYNPVASPKYFDPGPYPGKDGDHDRVKVYRGGSWKDMAYFLTTGARRYLNADSSASHIGFRCAMTRVGSPSQDY